MEKLMVSACLLGVNCKYSGGNNYKKSIVDLENRYTLVPVCPEVLGGLPTPRPTVELIAGLAVTSDGADVTSEFQKGALKTLDIARNNHCKKAVMKSRSPSCGCGYIYDGTFQGKLIPGYGLTVQLLMEKGIQVYDEDDIKDLL